ncbi:MAG: VWA domain-containing protein [Cyanobacteria bacterium REEB67]|nr:VWA domain-containing protein [Cyanobacteria bacterium REEB67]
MKFLSIDFLWLLAFVPALWILTGHSQVFGHSQTGIHKKSNAWSSLAWLTRGSKTALWIVLCLAMAQLQTSFWHTVSQPGGTIDITQDVSGSMTTGVTDAPEVKLAGPQFAAPTPSSGTLSPLGGGSYGGGYSMDRQQAPANTPERIDASLGAITMFIKHSHKLRIALTSFDDEVYYLYPPTTNHQVILDLLPSIKNYIVTTGGGGTNFDGPNGVYEKSDGALQGAINVLSKTRSDQARIFIMVTDGDSSIDNDRAAALAAQFKALHIHIFVFGIGDDWASNGDSIQPLKAFVKSVGGEVTSVQDVSKFNSMVSDIDNLAGHTVQEKQVLGYRDALIDLLKLAALFGAAYLLLSALSREQI